MVDDVILQLLCLHFSRRFPAVPAPKLLSKIVAPEPPRGRPFYQIHSSGEHFVLSVCTRDNLYLLDTMQTESVDYEFGPGLLKALQTLYPEQTSVHIIPLPIQTM